MRGVFFRMTFLIPNLNINEPTDAPIFWSMTFLKA